MLIGHLRYCDCIRSHSHWGGNSLDGGHRPSPSPTSRHNEEMENPCLLSLYSTYCFKILTREGLGKNLSVDSLTILLRRLIPQIIAPKNRRIFGRWRVSPERRSGRWLVSPWTVAQLIADNELTVCRSSNLFRSAPYNAALAHPAWCLCTLYDQKWQS